MMQTHMGGSTHDIKEIAPRRNFFGHFAGAAVLGLPEASRAESCVTVFLCT
jgi:hypothetical protein